MVLLIGGLGMAKQKHDSGRKKQDQRMKDKKAASRGKKDSKRGGGKDRKR